MARLSLQAGGMLAEATSATIVGCHGLPSDINVQCIARQCSKERHSDTPKHTLQRSPAAAAAPQSPSSSDLSAASSCSGSHTSSTSSWTCTWCRDAHRGCWQGVALHGYSMQLLPSQSVPGRTQRVLARCRTAQAQHAIAAVLLFLGEVRPTHDNLYATSA